ncbi:MAG: amidohydrolase [Clostridiales Family XIII bacterium]|jgi:5-methylthioadenosine/S-adenosylhomocysteine deaminase|nr:amidohydrolase [Clostridiales Family XIII bacterium]
MATDYDILFKRVDMLDPVEGGRRDVSVAVRDGRIAWVGEDGTAPQGAADSTRVIDGRGRLLIPGFYNIHAHSPMTFMRGYGENLVLQDWLTSRIFPFEDRLDADAVFWGTQLALAESFRFGIVSSSEMYFHSHDMARAIDAAGAKANLARCLVAAEGDPPMKSMPSWQEAERLREEWQGAGDGRIVVDASLHAEFTATDRLACALAEDAAEKGLRMQVHASETRREHDECKARHGGRTPIAWMAECGLLDVPTTAAHCVHVETGDIEMMAEKGVTVAANPVSNLKLASGIADIPAFLQAGVHVGIGTDGAASNNRLNLYEDMKYLALLGKAHRQDPTAVTPMEAFFAATRAGALAQGREDCGRICEGFRADLVLLDTTGPSWSPIFEMANAFAYAGSGSDVCLTMVDGRIVFEGGGRQAEDWKTIDLARVRAETGDAVRCILSAMEAQMPEGAG